jgi:hypothetical protein
MADTTTSRMLAEAALRAKKSALRVPVIAASFNPALGEIANATGMDPQALTPAMVGNLNYRAGIASQGLTDQADYIDALRTEVPEYTNAKHAYLLEKKNKAAADALAMAKAANPFSGMNINDFLPAGTGTTPSLDFRFANPSFAPIPDTILKKMNPKFYKLAGK